MPSSRSTKAHTAPVAAAPAKVRTPAAERAAAARARRRQEDQAKHRKVAIMLDELQRDVEELRASGKALLARVTGTA